jgi:hypothetical protein
VLEGVREPVRVRAAHVTDADLAEMAEHWCYRPPDGTVPLRNRFPRRDSKGEAA